MATYNTTNYEEQGGDKWVVGGELEISGTFDVNADLLMADDAHVYLGDGSDVGIEWDTAATPDQLIFSAAADDTLITVGNGTKDFDLDWYMADSDTKIALDASGDKLEFGQDNHGIDVYFYGDTADHRVYWDETNDTWEFGQDNHGVAVNFFGETANVVVNWDEANDTWKFGVDDTGVTVNFYGATADKIVVWDEASDMWEFGKDDTGVDVKFFGASSGAFLQWDEANDALLVDGGQSYLIKAAASGDGSIQTGTLTNDTIGTTSEDGYFVVNIGATSYKVPFWADD